VTVTTACCDNLRRVRRSTMAAAGSRARKLRSGACSGAMWLRLQTRCARCPLRANMMRSYGMSTWLPLLTLGCWMLGCYNALTRHAWLLG
jgi:hypothetical protein